MPSWDRLADELLRRFSRQGREANLEQPALGPQPGERVLDLGPGEGHDEEGRGLQLAQRRVDEVHRRQIAPLQIFEDQDDRMGATLGAQHSSKARRI